MGSLETLVMIPVGSADLVGAGVVKSITNTVNSLVLIVGELGLS
ncbi:hypothetical protein [Rhodococcus sp. NPDC003348]